MNMKAPRHFFGSTMMIMIVYFGWLAVFFIHRHII